MVPPMARNEFIIEAGAQGEGDGRWRAFFRIERHGAASKALKRVFLERRFGSPETAIQAALLEARKKINLMDSGHEPEQKPA